MKKAINSIVLALLCSATSMTHASEGVLAWIPFFAIIFLVPSVLMLPLGLLIAIWRAPRNKIRYMLLFSGGAFLMFFIETFVFAMLGIGGMSNIIAMIGGLVLAEYVTKKRAITPSLTLPTSEQAVP